MSIRPEPGGPALAGARHRPVLPVIGRRRFLIDRGMQLRPLILVGVLTLTLLVLLNLAVHTARARTSELLLERMPELEETVRLHDRRQLALVLSGSLVFLAGVVLVTLFETHKTAGAAFNIARFLRRIRAGEYGVHLRLRRDDNLKCIEQAFNEMSLALGERLLEDTETLERLAEQAGRVAGAQDLTALAQALWREADARRRAGSPREGSAQRAGAGPGAGDGGPSREP